MRALRLSSRVSFQGFVLGAAILAGCAETTPPEVVRLQARAAYERGQADLGEGRTVSALAAFKEAISLDKTNASYHNALGVVLLNLKQPETTAEALVYLRRAIELDPLHAEAHHNLGVALAETGQWEAAVAEYRKALSLPTFGRADMAQHNLGWALYNLGRDKEAEEALQLAVRLEPRLEGAHYILGLVLVRQGRKDEAKISFLRARDLAPESPFGQAATMHLKALGDGG
jgi:Flp pilus assembly protein TadD